MPDSLRVSAPASSANLGPGFDCLAVALDLRNEVSVQRVGGDGVVVAVSGEGVRDAPTDPTNLFVRAFAAAGADPAGLRFEMTNRVPFYRGLGSSAAAIAAGVRAGLAWSGRDADPLPIAVELEGHPDNVAASLLGRLILAWTAGARPRAVSLGSCDVDFVAVVPEDELPTRLAREALPAVVPHQAAAHTASRAALLVAAISSGRLDLLADALDDRLHEPYRVPFVPLLEVVRGRLAALPAYGATISGAGPSVLVWCERGAGPAVARRLDGVAPRVLAMDVAEEGARVE